MEQHLLTRIANVLLRYSDTDLDIIFRNTRFDCPVLDDIEKRQLQGKRPFLRQLELKRLISERLNGSFENWDVNEWIVHNWGGITRFNIADHNRITGFRDHINAGLVTNNEFKRISSLSKIASFVNPAEYFIYDSRVAFALDGILLEVKRNNPELDIHFFPLPSAIGGRDKTMKRYISNLYPEAHFLTPADVYSEYNALILSLAKNEKLKKNLPPSWVEMLLFHLGRTGGEIENSLPDYSAVKLTVKAENNKTVTPLKKGKNKRLDSFTKINRLEEGEKVLSRKGRTLCGYKITEDKRDLYVFVGEDAKKCYCEIISSNGEYSEREIEIIESYHVFHHHPTRTQQPYYIREYDVSEKSAARYLMENIKEKIVIKCQIKKESI